MTSFDQTPDRPPPSARARDRARDRSGRHLRGVPDAHGASDRRPSRVTLRDEGDLLALIPYTFGFHPQESLVMMLLAQGDRPMFARVDLPSTADQSDACCAELVQAATVNGGSRAVLVAYTDDHVRALLAAHDAAQELQSGAGVEVMTAIRADGRRWWRVVPELDTHEGVAYDLSAHPITASGVFEGRVTHSSRDQLAGSLLPSDPDQLEAVAKAHAALEALPTDGDRGLREEARWLAAWVDRRVEGGGRAEDVHAEELARVVRALAVIELRDVAWLSMSRRDADAHVQLWTDVVVRVPLDLLAPSAALLAFAAWLSGHGALAWCAIDRSLQSDPDHSLAQLVAQTLDSAMPPSMWDMPDRRTLTILSDPSPRRC